MCSTFIPSCSALSVKFLLAQAKSGRQGNTEYPSQPNPGARPDESPCTSFARFVVGVWRYNSWVERVYLSPGDVLFPSGGGAVLMAARIEYKEIDSWMGETKSRRRRRKSNLNHSLLDAYEDCTEIFFQIA